MQNNLHSLIKIIFYIFIFLFAPLPHSYAEDQTGTPFDLQGFIDKEIKSGKKQIVIPPGQYRVTPQDRVHLALKDLNDLEIIADQTEMICTETTLAISLNNCKNLKLRGLTIDYDPLPFTQGKIIALAPDKKWMDIELYPGYPENKIIPFKLEIFEQEKNILRTEDYYGYSVEKKSPGKYRINKPSDYRFDPKKHVEQVGDIAVIANEHTLHGNSPHCVVLDHCENVTLENITLYASNCFGFFEMNCNATHYYRCRIDRRSPADDLVKRSYPRVRSLDADAYHSKYAIRGPVIEECSARFQGDDCINICGDYHLITASQGKELRVLAKSVMNIRPGEPVELVMYNGCRLPDATAVSVESDGKIKEDERAYLSKQNMEESLKNARSLSNAYKITLDRDVDIPLGGVICSTNRMGNGFAVKGCNFGFNRSRGILIKASNGEVSNNKIEGSWMSAILVSPEYWWLEAGSSSNLKITGNQITGCKGIPILVESTAGDGNTAPAGAHQNIFISKNKIMNCAKPGILVTSTHGLQIEDNQFDLIDDKGTIPYLMQRAGMDKLEDIIKINCE